jgi:hypothetical protein
LIEVFIGAQRLWEKEVSGCASLKSLKSEGFNIMELDLNNKGDLRIEDLVNFVNVYSGHSYQNKDLCIIYKRLQLL